LIAVRGINRGTSKFVSSVLTYLTAETLPGVRSSDRRELDGVSGFGQSSIWVQTVNAILAVVCVYAYPGFWSEQIA
jgi:hypothetical protein